LAEFKNPVLVSTLDDLRKIVQGTTTHLVFDDFDCADYRMSAEQVIHLLDSSMPQTIKVRYNDITVPPIPRIFTTNKKLLWPFDHIFPSGTSPDQQNGILRRCRYLVVKSPMWSQSPPGAHGQVASNN
jgi:hypothetical protein